MAAVAHAALSPIQPQLDARRQMASVIILNYNYARYLKQCIESALAQEYVPLEVIVVDDGSTDDSRVVIGSYAGRLIASLKRNGGMVSAMNHGFVLSHGSVVIFVDADDYLLPGAVFAHVRALHPAGVVRSQAYLKVIGETQPSTRTIPARVAPEGDLRALVLERGPGAYVSAPNSGNAWSRGFLEQVFPLPEDLRAIGAETFLMDSAPLFGRIATLKQPGAAYRLHGTNMNGKFTRMTAANISSVIAQHHARIAWLEKIATALGHRPRAAQWESGNWRLLTLKYLISRVSGKEHPPSMADNLRPVFGIEGSFWKRLLLVSLILCIRMAPTGLSFYIAGHVIKLRYM